MFFTDERKERAAAVVFKKNCELFCDRNKESCTAVTYVEFRETQGHLSFSIPEFPMYRFEFLAEFRVRKIRQADRTRNSQGNSLGNPVKTDP